MIHIIFESHATTFDNEAGISSGWFDVDLSPLGETQAKELGQRYRASLPDVVFCSDLKRSWRTAELAFADSGILIVKDKRLRECDYGDFTRKPSDLVDNLKEEYITKPFPNGKSYTEMAQGIKEFLNELQPQYNKKTVMVIGSRATQYGLEHWLKQIPLREAVVAPWQWQPGWTYEVLDLP